MLCDPAGGLAQNHGKNLGCHGIFTSKMVIHWDFDMIEPTKLGDLGIEEQS